MHILVKPSFTDVLALLDQCHLPTADLTHEKLALFFGVRDATLYGVIGLEVHDNCGLLRSMAVAETHRGQGIAKQLIATIENLAHEKHLHSLFLLTTTASTYFKKHGYEEIVRSEVPEAIQLSTEFSSVCPKSAIVMKKVLKYFK